jgi:hypothetical protein
LRGVNILASLFVFCLTAARSHGSRECGVLEQLLGDMSVEVVECSEKYGVQSSTYGVAAEPGVAMREVIRRQLQTRKGRAEFTELPGSVNAPAAA